MAPDDSANRLRAAETVVLELRQNLERTHAETTRLYADLAGLTRQLANTRRKLADVLILLDKAMRRIGEY